MISYFAGTGNSRYIAAALGDRLLSMNGRSRRNIDAACGKGTAEFVKQAIWAYCGKQQVRCFDFPPLNRFLHRNN